MEEQTIGKWLMMRRVPGLSTSLYVILAWSNKKVSSSCLHLHINFLWVRNTVFRTLDPTITRITLGHQQLVYKPTIWNKVAASQRVRCGSHISLGCQIPKRLNSEYCAVEQIFSSSSGTLKNYLKTCISVQFVEIYS